MNTFIRLAEPIQSMALPATRSELASWARRMSADIGADFHLIIDISSGLSATGGRIVTSNWSFDALEEIGADLLLRIAGSQVTPLVGGAPLRWRPLTDGCHGADLCDAEVRLLMEWGHCEASSFRTRIGSDLYCALFTAAHEGSIRTDRLPAAQATLSYALSAMAAALHPQLPDDPLSERERECLFWAAEGKTSEEVATILSVTANTVNGYLSQAARKLSATNRAMAIATAIRGGII